MMGRVCEIIKASSHIQFCSCFLIHDGEVYGESAVMSRAFCWIGHVSFVMNQGPHFFSNAVWPVGIKDFQGQSFFIECSLNLLQGTGNRQAQKREIPFWI